MKITNDNLLITSAKIIFLPLYISAAVLYMLFNFLFDLLVETDWLTVANRIWTVTKWIGNKSVIVAGYVVIFLAIVGGLRDIPL